MEKLNKLRMQMLGNPIVLIVLFLPYFKPYGLTSSAPMYDWTFVAWKGLSLLCTVVLFMSRPKVSAITVLMGIYQAILLVSTVIQRSSWMEACYTAGSAAGFFLLLELYMQTNPKTLIRGMMWLLAGLCIANLITVLLYPGGAYWPNVYFIGTDNTNALYILPLLGLTVICACGAGYPLPVQICLLALFSASVYITWSATAVLSITVFIVLVLLFRIKKSYWVCNICVYYGVVAAVFFAVVVFRAQDHFAFLIEDLLHKDTTLTERTVLWDMAIQAIREHPLLGHGKWTNAMMWGLIGNVHCHNVILQVLFETGVVGLAAYLGILGCVAWKLMPRRNQTVGYMLAATIGALLLDFMAEVPIYPMPFYAILFLSWHVDEVTGVLESDRRSKA